MARGPELHTSRSTSTVPPATPNRRSGSHQARTPASAPARRSVPQYSPGQ
ncbi:hypothetical protein [Kitasatospora purpeofusca]